MNGAKRKKGIRTHKKEWMKEDRVNEWLNKDK